MSEENTADPIVKFNFKNTFPHKYWLSDWTKDKSYPNGFRYKILTSRNEDDSWVEFVVVMEEPGGAKTVRERMEIKLESFDQTAKDLIAIIEEELSIKFEEQDYSHIRNWKEFEKATNEAGWHEWHPKPTPISLP